MSLFLAYIQGMIKGGRKVVKDYRNVDELKVVKCEEVIEQQAREFQFELGFDSEKFVKDVGMPELWYSHAYGIVCDFRI